MKAMKRIITLFLCIAICAAFGVTAFAQTTPKITLSNVSAMPDDTITIDINIQNNPGIMGMAFAIAYEKDAFEYVGYKDGWLTFDDKSAKNHPDKGYALFVYVATSNKTTNGKMLSVSFKVKEKAAPGAHKIVLGNNNYSKYFDSLHNSFSNSNQEFIVPIVSGGTVTVGETCINAGHKWSEWNITKPADCDETGLKNHTCARCRLYEEIDIPITHDFEAEWTVDEAATPEKDGVMTRHCKNCDATTDRVTFTYEEVEGDNDTSTPQAPEQNNSSTTPNPPINNNVGDKNPIESVEDLKDYQENIKPNQNPDQDTPSENQGSAATPPADSDSSATDTSSSSDSSSTSSKPASASSDNKKAFSMFRTPFGLVVITVGSAVICSLIALVITLLVIKYKKK